MDIPGSVLDDALRQANGPIDVSDLAEVAKVVAEWARKQTLEEAEAAAPDRDLYHQLWRTVADQADSLREVVAAQKAELLRRDVAYARATAKAEALENAASGITGAYQFPLFNAPQAISDWLMVEANKHRDEAMRALGTPQEES